MYQYVYHKSRATSSPLRDPSVWRRDRPLTAVFVVAVACSNSVLIYPLLMTMFSRQCIDIVQQKRAISVVVISDVVKVLVKSELMLIKDLRIN